MKGSCSFRKLREMVLGKKKLGATKKSSSNSNRNVVGKGVLGIGLEFVKNMRKRLLMFGRKIRDSRNKRQESLMRTLSKLEALPEALLVRSPILNKNSI